MYSDFNLLSFMGTSDCGLFFSETDLKATEFNSMSKPTSEFQDKTRIADGDHHLQEQDQQQEQKQEQEEEKKGEILVSSLRIKTPSLGEFKDNDDDGGEGCRTPTSLDQRIPLIPQCPPAPRKPQKLPLMKRKAASQRILLDLSSEVEALFPPPLLGGKIKKVRIANGTK